MRTIAVKAERSGKWWALSAPEVPGVHSQVKSYTDAEEAVTEAIELVTGWAAGTDFQVVVEPVLPHDLFTRIMEAKQSNLAARQEVEATAAEMRNACRRLVGEVGLSQREVAALIGLSPQRVNQIVKSSARADRRENSPKANADAKSRS